jgi:hypothetical protein
MTALGNLLSRWTWHIRKMVSPTPIAPSLLLLPAPTTKPSDASIASQAEHPNRANFGRTRSNLQNMSRASMTETVDIRGLLAPGVSAEQARAALRQAWESDPMIRTLIDIAESQSDFHEPKALPRFSALRAADQIPAPLVEALDQVNKVTQAIRELMPAAPQRGSDTNQGAAPGADNRPDHDRPHGGALPR